MSDDSFLSSLRGENGESDKLNKEIFPEAYRRHQEYEDFMYALHEDLMAEFISSECNKSGHGDVDMVRFHSDDDIVQLRNLLYTLYPKLNERNSDLLN